MATLAVQEAMGMKVDREAVATLVLPQLWAMSMGPCEQFAVILLENITQMSYSAHRISIQAVHGGNQEAG